MRTSDSRIILGCIHENCITEVVLEVVMVRKECFFLCFVFFRLCMPSFLLFFIIIPRTLRELYESWNDNYGGFLFLLNFLVIIVVDVFFSFVLFISFIVIKLNGKGV
jgi:hypothetical protein